MQARRKEIVFRGFAVFLGLAVGLVGAELVLRLMGHPKPKTFPAVGLFEPDRELGYRLVANYSGIYRKSGHDFGVRINAEGFRDDRDYASLDAEVRRIVVVGDSFAFGMPVEANETFLGLRGIVWVNVVKFRHVRGAAAWS